MKRQIFSDILGAMFIARDSGQGMSAHVWPACLGIKKYAGCIQYKAAIKSGPEYCESPAVVGFAMIASLKHCRLAYYDFPRGKEAWLVTPQGKHWLWERIDEDLELLT